VPTQAGTTQRDNDGSLVAKLAACLRDGVSVGSYNGCNVDRPGGAA
jgi:hypothetical protein